jgi:hypothetical protein
MDFSRSFSSLRAYFEDMNNQNDHHDRGRHHAEGKNNNDDDNIGSDEDDHGSISSTASSTTGEDYSLDTYQTGQRTASTVAEELSLNTASAIDNISTEPEPHPPSTMRDRSKSERFGMAKYLRHRREHSDNNGICESLDLPPRHEIHPSPSARSATRSLPYNFSKSQSYSPSSQMSCGSDKRTPHNRRISLDSFLHRAKVDVRKDEQVQIWADVSQDSLMGSFKVRMETYFHDDDEDEDENDDDEDITDDDEYVSDDDEYFTDDDEFVTDDEVVDEKDGLLDDVPVPTTNASYDSSISSKESIGHALMSIL